MNEKVYLNYINNYYKDNCFDIKSLKKKERFITIILVISKHFDEYI
jgi:hypothetical protein